MVRRYTLRTLAALSRREQVTYLENMYLLDFHEALSLGRRSFKEHGMAELSAGWPINGKAVAEEALGAGAHLQTPEAAPLLQRLRKVRQEAADAVGKSASEERNQRVAALRTEEETLLRELSVRGRDLTKDPWVELDAVRRDLPANVMLEHVHPTSSAPWAISVA